MSKQDRQGVRTAAELERKYDFGAMAKNDTSKQSALISQLVQDMSRLTLALNNVWNTIYPIGAIYTSNSDTVPSELFGGTWELLAEGQLIVGSTTEESENIFFSDTTCYVWQRTS